VDDSRPTSLGDDFRKYMRHHRVPGMPAIYRLTRLSSAAALAILARSGFARPDADLGRDGATLRCRPGVTFCRECPDPLHPLQRVEHRHAEVVKIGGCVRFSCYDTRSRVGATRRWATASVPLRLAASTLPGVLHATSIPTACIQSSSGALRLAELGKRWRCCGQSSEPVRQSASTMTSTAPTPTNCWGGFEP
jgi:hypothetical protein